MFVGGKNIQCTNRLTGTSKTTRQQFSPFPNSYYNMNQFNSSKLGLQVRTTFNFISSFSNRLIAVGSLSKFGSIALEVGYAVVACTNCSPTVVDSDGFILPLTIGWDCSNVSMLNPGGNVCMASVSWLSW